MEAMTRISVVSLTAAGLLLSVTAGALARSPVPLTDGQLDRLTAGFGYIWSNADAAATGAFSLTQTGGTSLGIQEESPYRGQPNLGASGGASEATAVAVGANVTAPNTFPASSNTAVQTGGYATGNMIISHTQNYTVQGAGGVTASIGWTFVYGAWVGL